MKSGLKLLACLLLLPSGARAAKLLTVGDPKAGSVRGTRVVSYDIMLRPEEIARGVLKGNADAGVKIIVKDPRGKEMLRFLNFSKDSLKFSFLAGRSGRHRLEIAASSGARSSTYTITLEKIVSLKERLVTAPSIRPKSPRMTRLAEDLEWGEDGVVETFWKEVEEKGTPLVEALPDDEYHVLCTFVWRGKPTTKNVVVAAFWRRDPWMDYTMEKMAGTDIWHVTLKLRAKGRFAYKLAENVPVFPTGFPHPGADPELSDYFNAALRQDPLNPLRRPPSNEDDAQWWAQPSNVFLPGAASQPWADKRAGVPAGRLKKHSFKSAILKNKRRITVYTPPGYSKKKKPYPLLVLFDEDTAIEFVPAPRTLDNLLADGKIPPHVAVLVGNGPNDARGRELPCNVEFARFLNDELMPWVRKGYRVTRDPARVIVGGLSYGGLAATCAALRYPETFGNVLSQSGSYWYRPPPKNKNKVKPKPLADPNYVAGLFIKSPLLPIRFYLDAGTDELDFSGRGAGILIPNRHLRDVLRAKGYEVHYQEFIGGHDYLSWRGTLADGLILLTGTSK